MTGYARCVSPSEYFRPEGGGNIEGTRRSKCIVRFLTLNLQDLGFHVPGEVSNNTRGRNDGGLGVIFSVVVFS